MEGKGKFGLDSDEEHGIGLSPLFNTVLHNKFVRLFSENIYESFLVSSVLLVNILGKYLEVSMNREAGRNFKRVTVNLREYGQKSFLSI